MMTQIKFNRFYLIYIQYNHSINQMKKNSITDYYFCEDCETYHHPNRKIDGEYLAACQCQVLTQSQNGHQGGNNHRFRDSSLFKYSASSNDYRQSKEIFDRSLLSHQSTDNHRSIYLSPQPITMHSRHPQSNRTPIIKSNIINGNIHSNRTNFYVSNQLKNEQWRQKNNLTTNIKQKWKQASTQTIKGPFGNSVNISIAPKTNKAPSFYGNNNISQKPRINIGGKLSPPASPRNKSPPLGVIVQQPSRQSRIPWPTKPQNTFIRSNSANYIVGHNNYHEIQQIKKSELQTTSLAGPRNTFLTSADNYGSTMQTSTSNIPYHQQFTETFLHTLSPRQKEKITVQKQEPQCCGKLCYF